MIERKAWSSYFQDGMIDIFIGCIVLMFAVAPLLGDMGLDDFWSSAIFLPLWAAVYGAILWTRKNVIEPRIGVVKFGPVRTETLLKFNVVMFIVLMVGMFLGFLSFTNSDESKWIHLLRLGSIVLICTFVAAYYLNYSRLFLYGVLFVLSLLAGEWLWVNMDMPNHGFPVTFGITSAIIISIGLMVFFRLLRDNPLPDNEV